MTSPPVGRHRVVITSAFFEPGFKAGGPVKSIAEILDRLDGRLSCLLITSDRDLGDGEPYPGLSGALVDRGGHQVYYLDARNPGHWWRAVGLARRSRPELLYVNSVWSPLFTMLPVAATALRLVRPRHVLVSPRGELAPGALALKASKKRRVLRPWGAVLRRTGAVFHASTELEAEQVRTTLPWARTVVQINSAGPAPRAVPVEPSAQVRFAFFSRISAKKNLELALLALQRVATPVELDVYGPVEDAAVWARCRELIASLPEHAQVTYRGVLAPDDVHDTLAAYDAMVLPTLGENFGHVIAESLAAGCPVITSAHTPWTATLRAGAGAVVPTFEVADWASTLERWAGQGVEQRREAKARALVAYSRWQAALDVRTPVELVLAETSDPCRPTHDRHAPAPPGKAAPPAREPSAPDLQID